VSQKENLLLNTENKRTIRVFTGLDKIQLNNDTPRRYQLQTKSEANISKMSTLTPPTSTIDEKTSTHIAPKLHPGTENLETNNILDPSDVNSELIIFMKKIIISIQEK
jgi:hypothetical protein